MSKPEALRGLFPACITWNLRTIRRNGDCTQWLAVTSQVMFSLMLFVKSEPQQCRRTICGVIGREGVDMWMMAVLDFPC